MKLIFNYIILALSAISLSNCKAKSIPPTAEVIYLSSKDAVLYVRSIGYGKSNQEAMENAQRNAMEILLFRGIPGSSQALPMVSINEKEKSANKKYFDDFYSQSRYKTFLTNITPYTDYQKSKTGTHITVDLGINLKSLRADLEHNNIIRKFGY